MVSIRCETSMKKGMNWKYRNIYVYKQMLYIRNRYNIYVVYIICIMYAVTCSVCRPSQGAFLLIEFNEFSFKLDGTPLFHNSLSLRLFKENEKL